MTPVSVQSLGMNRNAIPILLVAAALGWAGCGEDEETTTSAITEGASGASGPTGATGASSVLRPPEQPKELEAQVRRILYDGATPVGTTTDDAEVTKATIEEDTRAVTVVGKPLIRGQFSLAGQSAKEGFESFYRVICRQIDKGLAHGTAAGAEVDLDRVTVVRGPDFERDCELE